MSAVNDAVGVPHEGFSRQRPLRYEGEVDIVTEVNERVERVIREILLEACSTYGMLTEEGRLWVRRIHAGLWTR